MIYCWSDGFLLKAKIGETLVGCIHGHIRPYRAIISFEEYRQATQSVFGKERTDQWFWSECLISLDQQNPQLCFVKEISTFLQHETS